MAKQNVSFIERHVEKIVAGVCGAVLAGVVALYLVRSPNRVEFGGESLGPNDFYQQFHAKAEEAQKAMQRVSYHPNAEQAERIDKKIIPNLKQIVPPYPDQLAVAFVPPSPHVPPPPGSRQENTELAEILAPAKPMGMPGRAVALLPQPPVISNDQQAPAAQPVNERDVWWVAIASSINRKAQRERFEAAHYNQDRLSFRITGIEVERQMMLSTGEWGTAENIQPYGAVSSPPEIRVDEEADTEPSVPPEQLSSLQTFISKIDTYAFQESLFLRYNFQQLLFDAQNKTDNKTGWWWEWTIPRKIKDVDADLSKDYGVLFQDEVLPKTKRPGPGVRPPGVGGPVPPGAAPRPAAPVRPRAGGGEGGAGERGGRITAAPAAAPHAATPPVDKDVQREVMDNMKKAEKAVAEDNYILADEMYRAVVTATGAPEPQKNKAQKVLDSNDFKTSLAAAIKAKLEADDRRFKQQDINFGPDFDPIWVTDITVTPGKTFRYRIRLAALNAYAGLPTYLKNPQDAAKVSVPGAWSEWSDAITAKPEKQVFAYQSNDPKSAQFEIHQWSNGEWLPSGAATLGVGEPVVAKSGRNLLTYDATIAGIEQNRPYRERIVRKDGTIAYKDPVMTPAVMLATAQGGAEEHLIQEDLERKKAFTSQKAEEKALILRLKELQVSPGQIQRPQLNVPNMGMREGLMPGPGFGPGPGPGMAGEGGRNRG